MVCIVWLKFVYPCLQPFAMQFTSNKVPQSFITKRTLTWNIFWAANNIDFRLELAYRVCVHALSIHTTHSLKMCISVFLYYYRFDFLHFLCFLCLLSVCSSTIRCFCIGAFSEMTCRCYPLCVRATCRCVWVCVSACVYYVRIIPFRWPLYMRISIRLSVRMTMVILVLGCV